MPTCPGRALSDHRPVSEFMTKLHLLAGITPPLQRLLEAAGVASVEDLAHQEPKDLAERLSRLSRKKRVVAPARKQVEQMVQLARKLVPPPSSSGEHTESSTLGDLKINLDHVPEAIAVPSAKPAPPPPARPADRPPTRTAAASVPQAPPSTPNRARSTAAAPGPPARKKSSGAPAHGGSGPTPPSTVARVAVTQSAPSAPSAASVESVPPAAPIPPPAQTNGPLPKRPKPHLKQKFRDFHDYKEGRMGVEPLPRKPADDEEEVEGALQRINLKPGQKIPRRVRRGVPHPRPVFLVFCSLIVLASRLLMMTVVIGTPLVLWPAFVHGDTTHLLDFLWVIGVWALTGVFYLLFAVRARCRVCTNPIFWSKRCMKNAKAHRLPGLGLVSSLALHALLFGWFRCMYCGTAIRLKFVADPERTK